MLITADEFTRRLNSGNNLASITTGPKLVDTAVAVLSAQDKTAAAEFGRDPVQIDSVRKANKPKVEDAKQRVTRLAIDRLCEVLDLVTTDEVASLPLRDRTRIGVDLAKIASSMSPREEKQDQSPTVLVLHAPATRNERDYTVINI